MTARQPIQPAYSTGVTVSPVAGAASQAIPAGTNQLILTNLGAAVCYVRVGDATVPAATTADYPIPAGAQVVITKGQGQATLSHISATGTTLHIMTGEGF